MVVETRRAWRTKRTFGKPIAHVTRVCCCSVHTSPSMRAQACRRMRHRTGRWLLPPRIPRRRGGASCTRARAHTHAKAQTQLHRVVRCGLMRPLCAHAPCVPPPLATTRAAVGGRRGGGAQGPLLSGTWSGHAWRRRMHRRKSPPHLHLTRTTTRAGRAPRLVPRHAMRLAPGTNAAVASTEKAPRAAKTAAGHSPEVGGGEGGTTRTPTPRRSKPAPPLRMGAQRCTCLAHSRLPLKAAMQAPGPQLLRPR